MIGKTLLVAIVLIGVVLSGCIEDGVQTVDNTTETCMNVTNTTTNASEHVGSQGVSIPLERPPFIEDQ